MGESLVCDVCSECIISNNTAPKTEVPAVVKVRCPSVWARAVAVSREKSMCVPEDVRLCTCTYVYACVCVHVHICAWLLVQRFNRANKGPMSNDTELW